MIPCSCAASSASAICEAIASASLTGIVPLSIRSASVGPDQLHHQGAYAVRVFEPVDLRDVRMIERCEHLRFPPKAREAIGIVSNGGQQDFDRDQPIERRIAGLIDLAHPARADPRRDLILADALPFEARRHPGIVVSHHGGRLEKALGALVRCQEGLHFLAQRLVAGAGRGEVGLTVGHRQCPRAREHLFQARPVVVRKGHWIQSRVSAVVAFNRISSGGTEDGLT